MHQRNMQRAHPLQPRSFICANPMCQQVARYLVAINRPPVAPHNGACAICQGSNQRRALRSLAMRLLQRGITRILILGGTSAQHRAIDNGLNDLLQVRCIDGSGRAHATTEAAPRLRWAQLLIIWSSTPLHHKVSRAYTASQSDTLCRITVTRPGPESLCREVLDRLPAPPRG